MIVFTCKSCGEVMTDSGKFSGYITVCYKCEEVVRIPGKFNENTKSERLKRGKKLPDPSEKERP